MGGKGDWTVKSHCQLQEVFGFLYVGNYLTEENLSTCKPFALIF